MHSSVRRASLETVDQGPANYRPIAETLEGSLLMWLCSLALLALLLVFAFQDGLSQMIGQWTREEYSHGYLIPLIALFLIWRNRFGLAESGQQGTWVGVLVVAVGLAMFFMGELGTIYTVIQYAFLVTIFGIGLACFGWGGMRFLWVPLLYLAFMIPLPGFLYNGLSSDLQLISSQLGVALIRLFDISVFLSGNVIDLGVYKLQVAEACSGLRYLFPLMSFGFLCAYLFQGPFWQKAVLFLSTIPITILMNSFRIGVIGVLVEHYGIEMAEGFLHQFEGWIIFIACLLVLFGLVWLFTVFSKSGMSVFDRFRIDTPQPSNDTDLFFRKRLPGPYLAAVALVLIAAIGSIALSERAEATPTREPFVTFPMRVADWHGRDLSLERQFVDALKLDDYVVANFKREGDPVPVNLYVAYYGSQRKGEAVHSPQSCIPGDGWRIDSFTQHRIDGITADGEPLAVNRAIITKGTMKQLVYYWFPQRDRFLTNEYWVKWYIFWDALTQNRTDGALIRILTPIVGVNGLQEAEERLTGFAIAIFPSLEPYF